MTLERTERRLLAGVRTKFLMVPFAESLRSITTLTFDCYGTLIDWRAGLEDSLGRLFGASAAPRRRELFAAYLETEAKVENEPYRRYRDVLGEVAIRLAKRFGLAFPSEGVVSLADMLPQWKPFSDTNEALTLLKQRFRLGVLSNIDRDLFAGTSAQFSVPFDFVVTAEDVGSYKPSHGHFERLLSRNARREEVLHVAQSLYHDGVPTGQLEIAFVWINRYYDADDPSVRRRATFPDLLSFAKAACPAG